MRRIAAALLAGCVFGAAPDCPALAQPAEPAAPANAGAASEPVVTLLDAGQADGRRELRFRPRVGTTETMVMRMKMGMDISMDGKPLPKSDLPTTVMTADITIDQIDSAGDIHYALVFSDVQTADDATIEPTLLATMKNSIAALKGLKAQGVVSDRGITRSGKFQWDKPDPRVQALLESATQSIQQMSAPYPAEPVGVGAKWKVVMTPKVGGFTQTLAATYTLVSMTADGVKLDISMSQTAAEQMMDNPAMPPGTSAKLKSLDGSGKGTMDVAFARVAPVASSVKGTATIDMSIKSADDEFPMKQTLTTELSISSRPATAPIEPKK